MSCEGVITPPTTPTKIQQTQDKNLPSEEEEVGWFVCQGKVSLDYASFASSLHQSGYLRSGDGHLFHHNFNAAKNTSTQTSVQKIQIFNRCFDKGSALVEQTDYLFENVKKTLYQLDKKAHPHKLSASHFRQEEKYRRHGRKIKCIRPPRHRTKVLDYAALRKQIVSFFNYIKNFVIQLYGCTEDRAIVPELIPNLVKNISSLRWILGPVSDYSDRVFEGGVAESKNMALSDEHHLFHLHLDLQWLSIMILYVTSLMDQNTPVVEDASQCSDGKTLKSSIRLLDKLVNQLFCDLIHLSVQKFRSVEDRVSSSSPFSCSCIYQLWILLHSVTTSLHQKFELKSYWSRINELVNTMINSYQRKGANECRITDMRTITVLNELYVPVLDEFMNPHIYSFWMLFHLTKAFQDSNLSSQKLESNYALLESTLKKALEENYVRSPELRKCFAMIESLATQFWEPNSSVIFVMWEYFQHTLDAGMFLVHGEKLQDQWKPGDSASSFLNQVQEIIDVSLNLDSSSFTILKQFFRIVAIHLQRTKDTPRVWNQIKGRIFSKFSARKINSLSEPGLINFFALVLVLAIAGDIEDVNRVIAGLMSEVEIDRRMSNRRKGLWKGYLALALLTLEKRKKVDTLAPPMIKLINTDLAITDNERMMLVFFDAFQEMLIAPCGLNFGQLSFIDTWIEKCITCSSELEKSSLLNSCLSLLCYLNAELAKGHFKADSGEARKDVWQLQIKLWTSLIPHLKQLSSKSSALQIVGELLAAFINFSLKISLSEARSEKVKSLFRHVLSSESVQLGVMKGYLKELIKHDDALKTLTSPQIFIQAWLKCSFMNEETTSSELVDVANYICQHYQTNRFFKSLILSKGDVFVDFVKALRAELDLCSSPLARKLLRDEAAVYLGNLEKWSSELLKQLSSQNGILRIYERIGFLVYEAGAVIYIQSGRTALHRLLDIFLLPEQVRDPAYALHPFISKAIFHSLNLFIQGLVRLGAHNDLYLSNTIKDLLGIYMPRLIRKSGALNDACPSFSLLKCFTECLNNTSPNEDCCVIIFQVVAEKLIKKRFRLNEPNHTLQAIAFIADVASVNRNKAHSIQCILDYCLESVSSVAMFYEKGDACQKNAERLMNGILTIHIVRTDPNLRQSAMNLFSKLCKDHLAFYSFKLFDLFVMIAARVPVLFKYFLPQLIQHVEMVEKKRGVTYDAALRDKGIKRIEEAMSGG